jgi:hypothetical protein
LRLSVDCIFIWERGGSRTLLVVTTGDLEQVTLELIAEGVADNLIVKNPISPFVLRNCICVFESYVYVLVGKRRENFGFVQNVCMLEFGETGMADFGAHALLHEGTELALIVDLDNLLRPIGRVGDVELHLDGGCAVKTVARELSTGEVEGYGFVDFSDC